MKPRFSALRRYRKEIALFCVSLLAISCLSVLVTPAKAQLSKASYPEQKQLLAQTLLSQTPLSQNQQCAAQPITEEERGYAISAWNYFVDNVQPDTGFANSVGGYPSGTLWDMGNYLTAMNAVRWMGLIDQGEFDSRLNKFLAQLSELQLFEGNLPNKVYNSATGERVDYANNPTERGIGWSALDIGRLLAAFHVIKTCHPQYTDWLGSIVNSWRVDLSVENEQMYGALINPEERTQRVQEGRLGYEEYAARGYELWGFDVPVAIALEPMSYVDIYGVQIPVDDRDYQSTNANNYVVSESYILDAIEFGLEGTLADHAQRVLEAQKRRYEATGLLTAVSEDNINQAPYFLYSTVYSNGTPWAVITEANENHPELRTLSAKAAFGWHYLYPEDAYAQQIFDMVRVKTDSGRGFYAGIYESGLYDEPPPLNDVLTGNTNGLILEILYYKARGNQPLIGKDALSAVESVPIEVVSEPEQVVAVAPIGPVRQLAQPAVCPLPARTLSITDQRYARNAWKYFDANYQPTGLVNDRSDLSGVTLWGIGDYLSALHAARSLDTIDEKTFDKRVRHLLGALKALPLFDGELPHRAYNSLNLSPVDYGGNANPDGNGWSGLDVGRLLAALHTLKTCHPAYTEAVDTIALDWSYLRVVRNGFLTNAQVKPNRQGRDRIRVNPAVLLGYEEYAARAFQLWGFDVSRSVVGNDYETVTVEGQPVPLKRRSDRRSRSFDAALNTTSTPFILYGLEFGFDPKMRAHVDAIFQAEAARYERTGTFSASGTTLLSLDPYVVHNTLVSNGEPWQAVTDLGEDASRYRMVSTAVAFAYLTLYPEHPYSQALWQATLDLYNPLLGYYEGFFEKAGRTAIGFSSGTNSLILQALLHKNTQQQPLIQPARSHSSLWWQQVRDGDTGQGLPEADIPAIDFVSAGKEHYWISSSR